MSDERTPPRGRLREHVAEEIRVLLARKRISAAELARRTGIKQSTMSRRMTGETAFDMDDLEVIAEALEVEVSDLLPKAARTGPSGGTHLSGSLKRDLTTPPKWAASADRTDEPRRPRLITTRPDGPTGPASRTTRRRPADNRPSARPKAA